MTRRKWLFISVSLVISLASISLVAGAWEFSKYGRVDVGINSNGYISLNIVHNGGSTMQGRLHLSNPRLGSRLRASIVKCGLYTLCIISAGVNHTIITVDRDKEYMTITRVLPEMEDQGRMMDCFETNPGTQWMGGPESRYQRWPIQNMHFESEPYVPTHQKNMAITERYWLNSHGTYIRVSPSAPMFLDQNNFLDNYLCFIIENKAPYSQSGTLNSYYEFGWLNNSRDAHEFAVNRYFAKPTGHPDELTVQNPIWSTWARFKGDIRRETVENFANKIISSGLNHSQLEIDDNWENCYGSATFDSSKFPNASQAIEILKRKGFRVTLWIHPFINEGCEPAYSTASNNSYFVKNTRGEVHTAWWRGLNAGIIDFTNSKAVDWWTGRLKELQKLGIDSFSFDAGETSWLPQVPMLSGSDEFQPAIYVKSYVTAVATNFSGMIQVRVGWESQNLPIFVKMIDKDSQYTWSNGLPTLITTLLQMNLAGYAYVLPDVIGGNGYLNDAVDETVYPPKDLFIRWLQATVFMPAMQFSFAPWDYDNETMMIAKQYTTLHAEITPTILRLMNNSISTGAPLNPPIWWVDPADQEAHKVYDEFLLGEEILVAPVINENSVQRDIYLPRGVWRSGNDATVAYIGPLWLRNFPAPLDVLPYFIRTV